MHQRSLFCSIKFDIFLDDLFSLLTKSGVPNLATDFAINVTNKEFEKLLCTLLNESTSAVTWFRNYNVTYLKQKRK